ncbi:MAG: hypothetical protein QXQ40_01890 [Candidatus Aenigmatarchaeota archaeon]
MLLQLAGSVLIALGIFVLYLLVESGKKDREAFILIVLSLAFIVSGGWLLLSPIAFGVLIKKLFGFLLLCVGGFLAIYFPGTGYKPEGFLNLGILLGLIFLIFGIYLVLF